MHAQQDSLKSSSAPTNTHAPSTFYVDRDMVQFYATLGTRMQTWLNEMSELDAAAVVKPLSRRKQKRFSDLHSALNMYECVLEDYQTLDVDVPQHHEIKRALRAFVFNFPQ
jgi:hypothetical protein